ncbi:MAG: GNAT family N-acetyltransferase [Polyangiaceae bacterium]
MESLRLETASNVDLPALLGMMEPFNVFEHVPWRPSATERALRKLLADPTLGVAGLFKRAGLNLGYFVLTWGYDLEWAGRDAFLTELFLLPEARGQGLGSSAMALVEQLAKEQGARALHLMVREENTPARRLYERQGYKSPPRIFLSKEL